MVKSIMEEQGPYYVRRAYRMHGHSFLKLHKMLKSKLKNKKTPGSKKKHKDGAKNGLISTATRLSAALRYFAGGRPDDIALSHGIAHSEVFVSVWRVVDAINLCADLAFSYPESHSEQKVIAAGFFERSKAGFKGCAGAIDGMLLWIERPNEFETERAMVGARKFWCGRKHKYGLNLQGCCDADGMFLDVSLQHPASTSDFLAFSTSKFQKKLERLNFLADGLVIFGDSSASRASS